MEKSDSERHLTLNNQDGMGAANTQADGGLGDLVKFALDFARRRYLLILTGIIFALCIAAGYLKVAPPTYKATTKLLVENHGVQFLQQQSIVAQSSVDVAHLENQIQILKSKPIAVAVINKLDLASSPEFDKTAAREIGKWISRISTQASQWWSSQAPRWWPPQLAEWWPSQTPQRWAWLGGSDSGRSDSRKESSSGKESSDDLTAAFESRLDGTRVGLSNVIEITYSASEPELAAKIANAVANAYLSEQWEAKSEASRVELAWLQKRLSELGQQTLDSERAVNKFRVLNNIVTVGGNSIDEQRITELNTRLVAARAQTSEALARMHRYESVLGSDTGQPDSSNADLDAPIADALTSPIINSLRQQYLEYARRSSEWTARFGKKHQAVVNLRRKMQDIRTSIAAELRRLAEASKNDYVVSKQREQAIEAQLVKAVTASRATDATEAKMRELAVNAKSYRTLYENFLQQYMRTVQQQSFPVANARVISTAAPPSSKSKPKSLLIMALAFAGGGAIGVALGLFRDLTDRVFRTTNQVESSLDTKCVSIVPMLEEPRSWNRLASKSGSGRRLIVHGSDRFWAGTQKPLSHFAESIRFIDLAINQALSFTSSKVVGVTSTVPNEGKTTIAAATATLIAQRGKRVIVVDCDLRNPSLSRRLTPEAPSGLVEVITGKCPLHETVWHDSKTNLTFLPLVTDPTHACPGDVLLAEGAEALFEELRRNYDYIIVDLPPLSPVVDVRTTTPWIDGFLLAVEWGRTKIDLVQHALHLAPDVREALIGVVLNKTDMKAIRRYDACQYYQRGYTDALERAA
jgi:exopolysaccharide transport family protein